MSVFVTSDLHVGHAKVAEMRAHAGGWHNLAQSPDVVEWHDTLLECNWDKMVKPDDTVWVLGDISAGGSAAQKHALEWIGQRNGIKHLIAGNHDGCHPMHRDSHKWQPAYLEVFESV